MSASLSAVPTLNFASVREVPEASDRSLNSVRSSEGRDSFSQVLRRTSEDQRSSGATRSRYSEKKDRKPTKKDDGTNTTTPIDTGNKNLEEKRLPITLMLGLPNGQLESFDKSGSSDGSESQIGANSALLKAKLNELSGGVADVNGEDVLLTSQTQDITTGSLAIPSSEKSDTSAATAQSTELLGIGESGNNPKGAAGSLRANTLAFAMRLGSGGETLNALKSANSADPASPIMRDAIQTNLAAATHNAIQATSGSTLEENTRQHEQSEQEQNVVDLSSIRTSQPFDTTKLLEDNATASTGQVPAEAPAVPTPEPVRNVHMQLVSEDNRRVDVRLIDRGGELHVSVKSADTALAQNLQDHLPDLTARLERQHMQTEVWVPKAAEPGKADSGNTNGSFSNPNARSSSGNSQGRKQGQHQAKPDWVDALENYSW
jgi:hypothetical protein